LFVNRNGVVKERVSARPCEAPVFKPIGAAGVCPVLPIDDYELTALDWKDRSHLTRPLPITESTTSFSVVWHSGTALAETNVDLSHPSTEIDRMAAPENGRRPHCNLFERNSRTPIQSHVASGHRTLYCGPARALTRRPNACGATLALNCQEPFARHRFVAR